MEFLILMAVIILIHVICLPKEKDIFNISRVGCRYVNWMGSVSDELHLTCQLASVAKPALDTSTHIECTLNNCPIVNEHMKGKQAKVRSSEPGPLTEGKTKTTVKPVGEGLDVMPVSPPPKPKPSGIRRVKEGKEKPTNRK